MPRTLAITLTAAVTAIALVSLASPAQAGCGGGGFYKPIYRPVYPTPVYRPIVHRPVVVHKPIVVHPPVVDLCRHPNHCYAWVTPGETLDAICLREYGDASLWPQVAKYNGLVDTLPTDIPLQLPSIYSNGRMVPSTAPAPPRPLAAPAIIPAAPLVAPIPSAPAA